MGWYCILPFQSQSFKSHHKTVIPIIVDSTWFQLSHLFSPILHSTVVGLKDHTKTIHHVTAWTNQSILLNQAVSLVLWLEHYTAFLLTLIYGLASSELNLSGSHPISGLQASVCNTVNRKLCCMSCLSRIEPTKRKTISQKSSMNGKRTRTDTIFPTVHFFQKYLYDDFLSCMKLMNKFAETAAECMQALINRAHSHLHSTLPGDGTPEQSLRGGERVMTREAVEGKMDQALRAAEEALKHAQSSWASITPRITQNLNIARQNWSWNSPKL